MTYDKKDLERRMEGAISSLSTEFSGLRTGRASVNLFGLCASASLRLHGTNQPGGVRHRCR